MNYGGFWIRFLAYLVDSLIVVIAFVAINSLLAVMGLELAGGEIVLLVLGILYYAFMQASARQATLGKALVGLKVGGMEGERIGFGRALAREVAKILSTLTLLIGFIMAGFTKRKQALHDLIASTCVVRAEAGHVVAALAIGLAALAAPFVAVAMLGAEAVSGMMGGLTNVTLSGPDMTMQAPPPKPAPKPAARAPKPAVASAPKPAVAAGATAPAAAPAPAPAPTPTPTPVAAPVEKPVVIPAAAPVMLAQAPEPPKAMPAEPPKAEKPKPAAQAPAAAQAPVAPPAPREPEVPPPAAPRVIPGPVIPAPRFNDLMTAVIYGDPKTVGELLALGKWPDKPDRRGVTALMLAALFGDAASAEALLKAGANPNRPGPGGDTATSIAREREDAAMVNLLQRYGGK